MKDKNAEMIWTISEEYRGFMIPEDIVPAVIRIVFLKYVTDNYMFAETRDDMMNYANMQRCIANRNVEEFADTIGPVLEMVDRNAGAAGLLARAEKSYRNDFFGKTNKKRVYSEDSSTKIIELLSALDLKEEDSSGKRLYRKLENYIYDSIPQYGRYTAANFTSQSINRLSRRLLDVNNNDVFKDFACGLGISAYKITDGTKARLLLSDVNEEFVQLAAMLAIIKGHDLRNDCFSVEDALQKQERKEKATKAFVDFPFGMKVDRDKYGVSEAMPLVIDELVEGLKKDGEGIIVCASSELDRGSRDNLKWRIGLLKNKLISSVILLPPVMTGTTVNVCVLVIKKCRNESILFIDASNNDTIQFSKNARKLNTELTIEGIKQIAEIYKNRIVQIGVSNDVDVAMVMKQRTLIPGVYIERQEVNKMPSLEEINNELNELYAALYKSVNFGTRNY